VATGYAHMLVTSVGEQSRYYSDENDSDENDSDEDDSDENDSDEDEDVMRMRMILKINNVKLLM